MPIEIRKAIAVVSAFALLAAACGDDDGDGFSAEIRDSYLETCETSFDTASCECAIKGIERAFSEEEFIRFAIEATEEPPAEFIEIPLACIGEADFGG